MQYVHNALRLRDSVIFYRLAHLQQIQEFRVQFPVNLDHLFSVLVSESTEVSLKIPTKPIDLISRSSAVHRIKMPPNAKRLSLQQKFEVIHIYDQFHSVSKAARIYKCCESDIRNIIRRKEEYLADWKNTRYVDLILKEWVYRSKLMGNNVSNDQIVTTGEIIIKKLKLPEISTMCWLRQERPRSYNEFGSFTGKIKEQKSLEIDNIIQDLRDVLDDMGYREPVTIESQIPKPEEMIEELDSDKSAEVNANQIYSITDDICEVDDTMNNLRDNKTETIDDVEIVDSPISPNNNTSNELELNQPFLDEIRNEKGTTVVARTYLDVYDKISCLEVNLLHEADLHGLKLINDLKKHLLTKIVDIKKNK